MAYDVTCRSNFREKITGNIESDEYIQTFRECAIPIDRDLIGDDFVLHQDNWSVHVSSKNVEFLERAGIEELPWPSRSLDASLIENV